MKPTFVYPYMAQLAQGQELKYSIRSLCKYVNFDFDVVIVGDKPNWYNGKHIQTGKVRGINFAKAFDINYKLKAMCESELISDDFIYLYDDVYCVNECSLEDFKKVIAMDYLAEKPKQTKQGGSSKWMQLLTDTRKLLQVKEAWSYETHLPRMFNKKHLAMVMDSYNIFNKPLLISTLYFNELFDKPDVVLVNENKYKAGIFQKMTTAQIAKACEGKLWMNNTENAWGSGLDNFLLSLLPNKCEYEN